MTAPGQSKRTNRWSVVVGVLQVLGSIALLYILLRRVSVNDLLAQREFLSWERVGLAFGAYLLSYMVTVSNWWIILRGLGVQVGAGVVIRAHLAGFFYGTVIPSSVSSDFGRGYRLQREGVGVRVVALSILIDRLAGFLVFAVVMVLATPFYLSGLPFEVAVVLGRAPVWGSLVGVGLVAVFVIYRLFPRFFVPYVAAVQGKVELFTVAVILSLIVHVLFALMTWLLVRPFWTEATLMYCLYVTEVYQIADLLPISFAGLGVREGAYALMFAAYGVTRAESIAVGLVTFGILLVFTVIGGLLELINGMHSAASSNIQPTDIAEA